MHFDNLILIVELQNILYRFKFMNNNFGHFINGEITYNEGKSIDIYNPANGESIGLVKCASKQIIET